MTVLNQNEFTQKITAFGDRNSPSDVGWFTAEELKRYERPRADYEATERWLSSYGIKILSVAPETLTRTIRTQGTVAQFEAAMNIRIDQSANGMWFANNSDPQIPANLDGAIASFRGLDNLEGYVGGPKAPCI